MLSSPFLAQAKAALVDPPPPSAKPISRRQSLARAPLAVTVGMLPDQMTRATGGAPRPGSARLDTVSSCSSRRARAPTLPCALPARIVAELQAYDVSSIGTPVTFNVDLRRMALLDTATGNAL